MALSEKQDEECWRINRNLNDFYAELVPLESALPLLRSALQEGESGFAKLRAEEELLWKKIVESFGDEKSLKGLSGTLLEEIADIEDLGNVRGRIAGTEGAIGEYEAMIAEVERRITELTTLMAQSWDAFYSTGCGLRHLPVGVPRPPSPRRRPARQIREQPIS